MDRIREKLRKVFSSFGKSAGRIKSIKSLCSAQDTLIDKQKDILKQLVTFYKSIYSENQLCYEKDCCD